MTSKEGAEFVLEAADGFEREAKELGQSRKFMAFLAQRSTEPGQVPLLECGFLQTVRDVMPLDRRPQTG